MRRHSVAGPLLLIGIGSLFLLRNFLPDFRIFEAIANYWPWLLIGWGVLRVVEILNWHHNGQLTPTGRPGGSGMTGGEWTLVVMICVFGSIIYGARSIQFPNDRIRIAGWDLIGESFDFSLSAKKAGVGKTPRVIIENSFGDVRISGVDSEEVSATGTKTIRSVSREDAENDHKATPFEIVQNGDQVIVRTNLDRVNSNRKARASMELTVPKGASIETRGKYGDYDIENINGPIEVNSDNAGVRMNNIGGPIRIDLRRSDMVRVMNAKAEVEIKGRGQDIELENIGGAAAVNGQYSGDIKFRNLAKPLRFESNITNLRVERIDGEMEMVLGKLTARRIAGPIQLTAKSKDVEFSDFTGTVEIDLEKGDIDLRPGRAALAKIQAHTKAGHAELVLPSGARLDLRGHTKRGNVENDFGAPFRVSEDGREATVSGSTGGGPEVRLDVDRGEIRIRKSGVDAPAPPAPPAAPKTPLEITKQ